MKNFRKKKEKKIEPDNSRWQKSKRLIQHRHTHAMRAWLKGGERLKLISQNSEKRKKLSMTCKKQWQRFERNCGL
jgi:hypothetical protein